MSRTDSRLYFSASVVALLCTVAPALAENPPYGGIRGVLETAPNAIKFDYRSTSMFRLLSAHQKEMIDVPVVTAQPFVGRLTLALDRSDNRYVTGERARVYINADQGAFVQLVTIGNAGNSEWLYPPERLDPTAQPRRIEANKPLVLPGESDGFFYSMDPPEGVSVLLAIVSSKELPLDARADLSRQLAAAARTGDIPALRGVVERFAKTYPDWRVTTVGLPYEIVARPGEPSNVPARPSAQPGAVSGIPAAAPALPPAGFPRPEPALPWLKPAPGKPQVTVLMDSQAYSAGAPATLRVRTEVGCFLVVLALGSGGQADMLYPNLMQHDIAQPAGWEGTIPAQGTSLKLRVRGPAGAQAEQERVVAVCLPLDLPKLTDRLPTEASPTLRFEPGSPELLALEALRPRLANLATGEVHYTVGPSDTLAAR